MNIIYNINIMISITLCSGSKIKKDALKRWIKDNFEADKVKIISVSNKERKGIRPEQPVGIGGMTCCHDRVRQIEEECDLSESDWIISIENSLNIESDKISDVVNVVLKDLKRDITYTKTGSPIYVSISLFDKYPNFTKIFDELFESYKKTNINYVYNGCKDTLGSLINKYYPDISKDNWMKELCNKDRTDQIYEVLSDIKISKNDLTAESKFI